MPAGLKKIIQIDKKYIALYSTFFLYSIIALLQKTVSAYTFLSKEFILLYSLQIFLLFIYAVIWQKILKLFSLSRAYTNKASVFIFNGFWAVLLFNESFTPKEIVAVLIVVVGIFFINRDV